MAMTGSRIRQPRCAGKGFFLSTPSPLLALSWRLDEPETLEKQIAVTRVKLSTPCLWLFAVIHRHVWGVATRLRQKGEHRAETKLLQYTALQASDQSEGGTIPR